ncbi:6-phosphofructokinase [Methanocella paludicola SANAE]|uniref:6-phosphofructokinase n=1 Tax=Methanocella paludicola (strain DSM 17711 / JCM 13418 / NBRC 101707 / SANAE) TaxID=304371 RepID=D1YY19_METPS|nr:ATP-dependent 6-phosphofructokinase [Methanocella paludicola]BAI61341.1 6-phosphofructokinase [Methanocella paludicola SANAE]
MKRIGIVTSGGDAPGMNAAIRAVVRAAHTKDLEIVGFERGWEGLINNKCRLLSPRSVSGILQFGGTILHTSRCLEFWTKDGLQKSAETLAFNRIDGLVVIGGDGSFNGAQALSKETDIRIAGVPATIDNDVYGNDETIGFDTAVNTAVAEIDKIRDTAASMDRVFVVEVMGRTRGFIALAVGLASGAETILVPEVKFTIDDVVGTVKQNVQKGKKSGIIVAAEGIGDTRELSRDVEKLTGIESRLSVLGYAQRGGNPTARSRYLAGAFGDKAVELLLEERINSIIVLQNGKVTTISLEESVRNKKPLDLSLLDLARMLAT